MKFGRRRYVVALLVVLVVVSAYWVYGQRRSPISGEVSEFISEYEELLGRGTKLDRAQKRRVKRLEEQFMAANVTDGDRERVVGLTTSMMRYNEHNKAYLWLWLDVLSAHLGVDSLRGAWDRFQEILGHGVGRQRSSSREQIDFLQHLVAFFDHGQLGAMLAFEWSTPQWADYRLVTVPDLGYRFEGVDLHLRSSQDSLVITGTSGTYYPFSQKWVGRGGRSGWQRSGYSLDSVFAELGSYEIDMRRDQYRVDTVQLRHPEYFDRPLGGSLFDRLSPASDSLSIQVPEFTSFERSLAIRDLMEGVDFKGGVVVQGSRLIGVGTPVEPVLFDLKLEDRTFLHVETQRMAFKPKAISSDHAEVTIYLGKDSLYHSGLYFEYSLESEYLRIRSSDLMVTRSPLYSSYHGMTIFFDELAWRQGDSLMTIGPRLGTQGATAVFQSNNYFDREEFDRMMGMDNFHPVLSLSRYSKSLGGETHFGVDGYAQYIRKPTQATLGILMQLAVDGLLLYDSETRSVQLLPRLFNMVKARGGHADYDAIRFSSTVQGRENNATINLNNFELSVNHVSPIQVSKTSGVQVRPRNNFVRLGGDRNLAFDGSVDVGQFHFQGDSMVFDYETFTIEMKNVSALNMEFPTGERDFTGRVDRRYVQSTMRNLTGQVYIDDPGNKSGTNRHEEYPYFESTQPARVYYDAPNIGSGAYSADTFYFEVDPFVFHNLSNYEPKDLVFSGTMYPGGVLEPFADSLSLRPDNSLGFVHAVADEGMPIYNGKGMFYNNLDLSNSGLRGAGRVTYRNTTLQSEGFNFFPDSLTGLSTKFAIAAQTGANEFPAVEGTQFMIHWVPKEDELRASTVEDPFSLYAKEVAFKGTLVVRPDGLGGYGEVDMSKARMQATDFTFLRNSLRADSMGLSLAVVGSSDSLAFRSDGVRGRVDYAARQGVFEPVSGGFVGGQFVTIGYGVYADRLRWPIDADELHIETSGVQQAVTDGRFQVRHPAGLDSVLPVGSVFYSTVPKEEGLYFLSPTGKYFLRYPRLYADSVDHVLTADAVVYLPERTAEVMPTDRLLPFRKVKMRIGAPQKYHEVYDVDVRVFGANAYGGRGRINYVDNQDSVTPLRLDTILVRHDDSLGYYSHGQGKIEHGDSLMLSERFAFVGKVSVDGYTPHYAFEGGVLPLVGCGVAGQYTRFSNRLDPSDLRFPLTVPANALDTSAQLIAGSVLAYDSIHVYPSFMSYKSSFGDKGFSSPSGFMTYESRTGFFVVQDSVLFDDAGAKGRRVAFDPHLCRVITEGPIELPFRLGRPTLEAVGTLTQSRQDSSVLLRAFMELDFFFNSDLFSKIAGSLAGNATLAAVDYKQPVVQQGLRYGLDSAAFAKVKNQVDLFGKLDDPLKEFDAAFTLADMAMRWDQGRRSLVSMGTLGIGQINGIAVNRRVNGFLEVNRRYTGDHFILYLEPSPGEYYLFVQTGGTLYFSASDQEMLRVINELKAKKRRQPTAKGEPEFEYMVGSSEQIAKAQQRYRELQQYHL